MPKPTPAPLPAFSSLPLPTPPPTFSAAQAEKAVNALYAHHQKHRKEKEGSLLIEKEEYVFLCMNTKVMPRQKSNKPIKIQLPHPPLPPPPATSVCLLTPPPQRTYKDLLASPEHNIKFISRVVDTKKLGGKHKPFEARRALLREHEVFLCDERVVEKMPKLLGKMWFEAKKQPIPVNLKRKDLKAELARAISSTYFHESLGTSSTIRIATPSHHTPSQILENLLSALPQVISRLSARLLPASASEADALPVSGWDLIHSVGIKTSGSAMLPIWSCKVGSERFGVAEAVGLEARKRKARKEEEGSSDEDMEGEEDEEDEEMLERVVKRLKKVPAGPAPSSSSSTGKPKKSHPAPAPAAAAAAAAPKPKKSKPSAPVPVPAAPAPAQDSPKPKVSFSSTPLGPSTTSSAPKKVMAGKKEDAKVKKVSGAASRGKVGVKAGLLGKARK